MIIHKYPIPFASPKCFQVSTDPLGSPGKSQHGICKLGRLPQARKGRRNPWKDGKKWDVPGVIIESDGYPLVTCYIALENGPVESA